MANIYDQDEEEARRRSFSWKYFARMIGYMRPYRKKAAVVVALMLVSALVQLAEPLLVMEAIDKGVRAENPRLFAIYVGTLLVLYTINMVAQRKQIWLLNWTGQKILFDLREDTLEHVTYLSLKFYDGRPVGKIMARITNDVNAIGELVNNSLLTVMTQAMMLLGIIVILLRMHVMLALISLATMPFLFAFLMIIRRKLEDAWYSVRQVGADMNAHLNESLTGLKVIQGFSGEVRNSARFDGINRRNIREFMKAIVYDEMFWPVVDLLGAIGACSVVWYGAGQVIKGVLTIGAIVAFMQYLNKFWGPLSTLSKTWSQMLSAMASAERVFGFIDTPPEVTDLDDAVDMPQITGDVVFKDVAFGYQEGQEVIHGVNLHVKPGMRVALVGPTGAGKSTIVNLLGRFYDPTAGAVYVDGYDIKHVTLQSLHSQLGVVLQDTFIFSGTIMENIRYGRLDATEEEVKDAARAVGAHDFIETLPNGYETSVGERGSNLSTGQRQLVAFARALIASPRLLILDEATSSIDTQTERKIQQAIEVLLKGRTSFIIAHRLSTIETADLILVIDDGQVIEQGTHRSLLEQKGTYYRLYEMQFQRLQEAANG
jgi:ATP-binding cassette subfamily B protein